MHGGVVLITGGGRRIGAAIARELHGAGCRVVLHCHRSRAQAEALAAELNARRAGSCAVVQADLLDIPALARLAQEAGARFGQLDALVNNASSFHATPFGAIVPAHWDELMGTNLRAPLLLSQAAAPMLRESRGAIVNIADIHADRPLKDFAVYSIAKAGLAALTRALALELGPDIRVNAVSPGAILWPEHGEHFAAAEKERIAAQVPLGRVGEPSDVARAVKYLLFDAPYVTGQVLAVDGGRSIHL